MINNENAKRDTILIELSIMATCHGILSHFKIKMNSAKAIVQPMAKMILNLVCDSGDEAMGITNRTTRNIETFVILHSIFLVQYSLC
jgi:hypothetical protein